MNEIVGRWTQIEGQPYEGLWFSFASDGTFEAKYDPMGISSGGTYLIENNKITMLQETHTFGMVGEFKGLVEVEGDILKIALPAGPGQECPENLDDARIYRKA